MFVARGALKMVPPAMNIRQDDRSHCPSFTVKFLKILPMMEYIF